MIPFLVIGLVEAWHDSPTNDEAVYIAAGVTSLTRHQIQINLEHPPLAKALAALPVLAADPVVPVTPAFADGHEYAYTAQLIEAQVDAHELREVVFLSRLVPLAESLALGFCLYGLAASLWGRRAGVVAGLAWYTTPFVVGLGHLDIIDAPFTLATVAAVWALARYVRRPAPGSAALLGLACGVSLLTESKGLLLVPVLAGVAWWAGRRRGRLWATAHAAGVLVLAWGIVWVGYRAISPFPAPSPTQAQLPVFSPLVPAHAGLEAAIVNLVPWPQAYSTGVTYLARVDSPPSTGFVWGHVVVGPHWWYWPASMAVKLPWALLAGIAIGLACWAWRSGAERRHAALVVGPPFVVLAAFTLAMPHPIGLRYMEQPIALLVVAGAAAAGLWRRRWGAAVLAVLGAAQLAALVGSAPNSLAWTQPPLRPAYRYVSTSDVDWGQGLYLLRSWAMGKHPWVAYMGPPGVQGLVPGERDLIGTRPSQVRGWVAVSASALTVYHRQRLSWLRNYCPVQTLGGSILVYRFASAPVGRPGPVTPPGLCAGAWSVRAP